MARTEYEGAQSTTDRLYDIGRVYDYNGLVSDAAALGSTFWLEGLNGEFPESGLVPTAYLYSLVGVSAEYDGLHIRPVFNQVYEYMGVRDVCYGDAVYNIRVNRDGSCSIIPDGGTVCMQLHYQPERFQSGSFLLLVERIDGSVASHVVSPDENGVIHWQLDETDVDYVMIQPILP
jgi:hypothetical protein